MAILHVITIKFSIIVRLLITYEHETQVIVQCKQTHASLKYPI